jgi:hypothetical protein
LEEGKERIRCSDSYNVSHVQLSDHCREGQAPMWSCESAKLLNAGQLFGYILEPPLRYRLLTEYNCIKT